MLELTLLREKQVARLERLIKDNAPYEEVLKQSQVVDEFITQDIKEKMKEYVGK